MLYSGGGGGGGLSLEAQFAVNSEKLFPAFGSCGEYKIIFYQYNRKTIQAWLHLLRINVLNQFYE